MSIDAARRIPLIGCRNFRDVGGYCASDGRAVRERRLFRSDALHLLTEEDLASIAPFGIRTVFDLRSPRELESYGIGDFYRAGAIHNHVPFFGTAGEGARPQLPDDPAELYLHMLDRGRGAVAQVFLGLTEEDRYPAVIHCSAGKDRTGVLVALLLRVLGVPDQEIVADYALSDACLGDGWMQRLGNPSEIPAALLRAEPATLVRTLAAFDERYGSTQRYLDGCGVTSRDIERLRSLLLVE